MDLARENLSSTQMNLAADIEDMRHNLLLLFMIPLILVPFAWAAYANKVHTRATLVDLAAIVAALTSILVFRLRARRIELASPTFLLGIIVAHGLVIASHPDYMIMAFGVLVPLAAFAMIDSLAAFVFAVLSFGSQIAFWVVVSGEPLSGSRVMAVLCLYAAVFAAAWLGGALSARQ